MKLLEQRRMGALFFAYNVSLRLGDDLDFGLKRYCPKGFGFNKLVCSNDEVRWLFDEDELVEAGRVLVEELWKNIRQASLLFDLFDKVRLLNQQFSIEAGKRRPSAFSTEEIVQIMAQFFKGYDKLWELGAFAELVDFYLSRILKELLVKKGLPAGDVPNIIAVMSAPDEESFARKAEKGVLQIAAEIEKRKLSSANAFSNPEIAAMLQKHLNDFYWVTCNYFSFSGLGLKSLKRLIEATLRHEKPASERLFEFEKKQKDLLLQKKGFEQKFGFDAKTIFYFKLLQNIAIVYDNRKKSQMHAFYFIGRLLKELARRAKVNSDLAKYLFSFEIPEFAKGKISPATLFERRKYTFIDFNVHPPKILAGEQAKAAEEKLWKGSQLSQSEVNGACASPGTVIARARVIRSTKSISEFKKGEILVTGMTSPEYVPVLGKAVGIITDDGGLTCHAAIIARELGIPCIVGTKVATRTIKTGDLVELRAKHGLARITERVEKTL